MPGNVCDQNTQVCLIHDDEIVKITRHGAHWDIARSDFHARDLGNLVGQDGQLNLSRHLEFIVYVQELPCQLVAGLAKYKMGVDACFHDCRRERFVDVVYSPNLEPFRLVISVGLTCKEDHWYVPGLWRGFQDAADCVEGHLRHHHIQED